MLTAVIAVCIHAGSLLRSFKTPPKAINDPSSPEGVLLRGTKCSELTDWAWLTPVNASVILLSNELTLFKVMMDNSVSDHREAIPSSLQLFLSKQRHLCVTGSLLTLSHELIIVVFGSLCAAGSDVSTLMTSLPAALTVRAASESHCE